MKISIKSLSFVFLFSFFTLLCNVNSIHAQMYWNQAASFAGNLTSYVSVPNSASLNITGSFSIEAWVNPSNTNNKGVVSKGGSLGTSLRYAIRITASRVVLIINGAPRLSSKVTSIIPVNTWTHIAATYSSSTNEHKIFINGFLDTSAIVASTSPSSNTDSLYIGISGSSTPFAGKIDEVRIWDSTINPFQVPILMKSTLGITGDGILNHLVLSMPFQNNTGTEPFFSTMDFSEYSNNGFFRNVTAFDLKNRPSKIHQYSDCAYFQVSGGGFIGNDNAAISPTNKITIECWVFPKADNYGLIFKGNSLTQFSDYGLKVANGKLNAYINNTVIVSNDSVKKERWSHIAFTYFGTTGAFEFYVNGKRGTTGNNPLGNIIDGTDALVIGAHPSTSGLIGFLDELRITNTVKTIGEINNYMFTSINESNDNDALTGAVYNFDASTFSSVNGGPRLIMAGTASFTFNGAFNFGLAQSPVVNLSSGYFQNGYYLRMPNKRIPATGTTGTVRDTLEIITPETITDMNIFIALNHNAENTLRLHLTSPLGATVEFFATIQLSDAAANIITIFDNDADSSLINGNYINFGPKIKPQLDLNAIFAGDNAKGKWVLSIIDESGTDTGFISGWGLQINNKTSLPFNLDCTSLNEGFYNPSTNLLTADTMRFYLRTSFFPFSVIDSSNSVVNSSGSTIAPFENAQPETDYFLVLKHRNSLETWSSSVIRFSQFTKQASYNFSDLISRAFGNNMKQADDNPVRFAVFSGDVNQDGNIDLNDIIHINNDANNFVSGYLVSDVTGNNLTDLDDVLIAYNNSVAFVGVVKP